MGRRPLTDDGSTVVYQLRLPAALRDAIKARGGAAWVRELVEAEIARRCKTCRGTGDRSGTSHERQFDPCPDCDGSGEIQ